MRIGRRRPPQDWNAWSPTGTVLRTVLPLKQLPAPAGPASARSARPEPAITLSRTWLPADVQKCSSRLGVTRIPWLGWSSTRLRWTRESLPPASTMPLPNPDHSTCAPGAARLPLSCTRLPTIRTSLNGGSSS